LVQGKFAHSGFPEISYGRFSDRLISKGFKVARVEQTETPDQNKDRCTQMGKHCSKWDKVVRRELCRITTPATRQMSVLDENAGATQPRYLLAIATKVRNSDEIQWGHRVVQYLVDTWMKTQPKWTLGV
jgi:DNA mismatch repair protein MSH6